MRLITLRLLILFYLSLLSLHASSYVIITVLYNSEKQCHKIIESLTNQVNADYEILLIDDGSTDDTPHKVPLYLKNLKIQKKVRFIRHNKHKGILERAYQHIHKIDEDKIVIYLNQHSYFSTNNAIEKIDALWKQKKPWLLFFNQKNAKTKRIEKTKTYKSPNLFFNSMRGKMWHYPHLKIFPASLFKKVKLQEFFFRGQFYSENFEETYMFPMMEMAEKKVHFSSTVLCEYFPVKKNKEKPCDSSPIKAKRTIIKRSAYSPLSSLNTEPIKDKKADLLIFSYDRPMQLWALLESVEKNYSNVDRIYVIYRVSNEKYEKAYQEVKMRFSTINLLKQSDKPYHDFKPLVVETLFGKVGAKCPYVIFAVDDMIAKAPVDIATCIEALEKTKSYFFSLRLGKSINYCYMGDFAQPIPYHIGLDNQIIAWQLDAAKGDWMYDSSVDMTLYRKQDLKKVFKRIAFTTPNNLEPLWSNFRQWYYVPNKKERIGLCFSSTKALNIPLNLVNQIDNNKNMAAYSAEELLEKFQQGYRIDIRPISRFQNEMVHIDYYPDFIR